MDEFVVSVVVQVLLAMGGLIFALLALLEGLEDGEAS